MYIDSFILFYFRLFRNTLRNAYPIASHFIRPYIHTTINLIEHSQLYGLRRQNFASIHSIK